jgi:Na+/melibiose symporter-like transporter
MTPLSSADPPVDLDERPTAALPLGQLVRLSLYWLGLSSIFAGITAILGGRLEFEHLVPAGSEGSALFQMTAFASLIAAIVQPTVGSLSDYTTSRWGRRKPYIVIGSLLDVVFLVGIAGSSTVLTIAAFMTLLQISANVAQGPFEGYVPDLVPERQVGLASALVGMFQVLGNVMGAAVAALAVATGQYAVATVALGVIEVLTMLSVALGVREGRAAKDRAGRSWAAVAREAWGTDLLHERSFLWLVGSRLFVLIGSLMLLQLGVFYVVRSLGLADKSDAGQVFLMVSGLVAAMVLLTVVPAARASDRLGRKPVIYAACGVGALALSIIAVAPSMSLVLVGAGLLGVSTGSFLAVDWALMTDIIPKASSGRFMGSATSPRPRPASLRRPSEVA